ncbi:MAG: hypothetical protein RLZZ301_1215 [Bacteroidota bacterium]|jgi:hypothetical protein
MMHALKKVILNHAYFSTYLLVYGLIQIGLIHESGRTYALPLFFLFFVPFVCLYVISFRQFKNIALPTLPQKNLSPYLLIFSGLTIVLHLYFLKQIPFVEAWQSMRLSEANQLRKAIGANSPRWMTYMSTWTIRCMLPFSLVYFAHQKAYKKVIVIGIVAAFYALCLLQKSLILWIGFPLLIYSLLQRRVGAAALSFGAMCLVFGLSLVANNPQLHGGINDLNTDKPAKSTSHQVSEGLAQRIAIIPGKMVSEWFKHVPKDKPYLWGTDMNLYCKISQQKQHDYALELYPVFYPEYAKKGIQGSVNVAHFMRGYANFGYLGLFISAAFLALFLVFINKVQVVSDAKMAFSLQLFPIFLLSSGSLLTLLMSGGWSLIVLLLVLNKPTEIVHE